MANSSSAARAALGLLALTLIFDFITIGTIAYASGLVGDRKIQVGPTYVTYTIGYVYRGSWAFYTASSVIVLFVTSCSSVLFTVPLILTASGDEMSMEVTKSFFFGLYHLIIAVFLFSSSVASLAFFSDAYSNTNINCVIAGASFGIISCVFHAFAALVGIGRPSRDLPGSREDP